MAEGNGNGNGLSARQLPAWVGSIGAVIALIAFVWVMAFNPINVKFDDLQKQVDRRFEDSKAQINDRLRQHEKADDEETKNREKSDHAVSAKVDDLQRQLIERYQLFPTQLEFKATIDSLRRDADNMAHHHVGRDEYTTAMQAIAARLDALQHSIDEIRRKL